VETDKLRINQLSPKTYEWYLTYLQAVDTKNIRPLAKVPNTPPPTPPLAKGRGDKA